jgi:molybdopterin molybdotransferase
MSRGGEPRIGAMLSFDEALQRLLSRAVRVSSERVPLGEAAGRVLALDVVAREPLPGFDHSAMDGYAVDSTDFAGEPPWVLPVVGESAAGRDAPVLAKGTACRIFTGAPLPVNADAVVMQEYARREHRARDVVVIEAVEARPGRGRHVRRTGEDIARHAIALAAGQRLSAGGIALAAMVDRAEVVVARRPRVTILCTGDELRGPGDDPRPASVPESNSAPLAALVRQCGAIALVAPITGDDPDETQRAIERALEGTDVLLTVGGVSVGDRDVVRPALERAGVTLDFWKVAIKPGKPLAVGARGNTLVLGLPGNPASAIVTFALFGAPLLRALQGDGRPRPLAFPARLAASRRRSPDRREFVRARLAVEGRELVAIAHDNQASGATTSLASSDGLAVVVPGETALEAGAPVDFLRWSDM